jgi:hypothetical protein
MTGIQIALLIIGAVVFIVSFFLPSGSQKAESENDDEATAITREQIQALVDKEAGSAKERIGEIVDETITYAMEKGERAMERVTNEKMMAINEYSDTVLEEIRKNQQEVVFLYDMLNSKHSELLGTVSQVNLTVNEAKHTPLTVPLAEALMAEAPEYPAPAEPLAFSPFVPPRVEGDGLRILESANVQLGDDDANNNERILELHKAGKTNMNIAKTLGLGIGEVNLVIDLFEE